MRVLAGIVVAIAVLFIGVMGFYWMRDGSLESAGREMDDKLQGIDRTTQPLQDSLGEVGDGVKKSIDNATDGDDKT
jgi:hypothetical protein